MGCDLRRIEQWNSNRSTNSLQHYGIDEWKNSAMPILCTFTDTQKCQSNQSTTLPGSPCSKNSPATATTGVPSSQEVSRIRQPHQVLFPSIDFHNFPLQCLARTCPHSRVCPSVHTTHTQVRNQVIMLWAMPSSMHLQAYSASQWVRVQMQSVTSHVFKEIPSASFSILQPNFTRKCPRWLFGSLARWSQLQWLPEFCAPKTAGAWVKQKLKDKTVPLKCNDAIQPIMYLFA